MPVTDENHIPEAKTAIRTGSRKALHDIGKGVTEQIDQGFEHGEDALGQSWKPLAEETIRKKGSSEILIESGDMRKSIGYDVNLGDMVVRVGSNDPKLEAHERGVPERGLPPRPVLTPAGIWAEKEFAPETFRERVSGYLDRLL